MFVPNMSLKTLFLTMTFCLAQAEATPDFKISAAECPDNKAMMNFDIGKYLGEWHVQEFQYIRENNRKNVKCVSLKFSIDGFGNILTNLTFRIPQSLAKKHIFSTQSKLLNNSQPIWKTRLFEDDLFNIVMGTDYSYWTVLAQCNSHSGETTSKAKLFSYRIMSRNKTLDVLDHQKIKQAMEDTKLSGFFHLKVDQDFCSD